MWFVIVLAALVIFVAGLALHRRSSARRTRPAFSELSREDQVQAMRQLEGGGIRHGEREGAKHHGSAQFGQNFGSG